MPWRSRDLRGSLYIRLDVVAVGPLVDNQVVNLVVIVSRRVVVSSSSKVVVSR